MLYYNKYLYRLHMIDGDDVDDNDFMNHHHILIQIV